METINSLKSRLVDRIMLATNEKLLMAMESILTSVESPEKIQLDSYQIEMLALSEEDIQEGNLISDEDLQAEDAEWMS
jgi:hypothetical protein